MSRRKLTNEELIEAIQEYLDGKGGYKVISKKYGINPATFRKYVKREQAEGINAVIRAKSNKKYHPEFKKKAVEAYLSGQSQVEVCTIYGISSRSVLQNWISCYNSGKDFKE